MIIYIWWMVKSQSVRGFHFPAKPMKRYPSGGQETRTFALGSGRLCRPSPKTAICQIQTQNRLYLWIERYVCMSIYTWYTYILVYIGSNFTSPYPEANLEHSFMLIHVGLFLKRGCTKAETTAGHWQLIPSPIYGSDWWYQPPRNSRYTSIPCWITCCWLCMKIQLIIITCYKFTYILAQKTSSTYFLFQVAIGRSQRFFSGPTSRRSDPQLAEIFVEGVGRVEQIAAELLLKFVASLRKMCGEYANWKSNIQRQETSTGMGCNIHRQIHGRIARERERHTYIYIYIHMCYIYIHMCYIYIYIIYICKCVNTTRPEKETEMDMR